MGNDEKKNKDAPAPEAPKKKEEEVKKVEHKNIFEALSAFQGENPEIKKTKDFGSATDKMHFKYAPLDETLSVVRPLLAKHGLSVTWEARSGGIVCALYHETYEKEVNGDSSVELIRGEDKDTEVRKTPNFIETGVLRSMPIEVTRKGDMKEIGKNSTYARRYTLNEVLGIASDDDMDDDKLRKNAESFAFAQAKKNIETASGDKLQEQIDFLNKELIIAEGLESEAPVIDDKTNKPKVPSLGLKAKQYQELLDIATNKANTANTGASSLKVADKGNPKT